MTAYVELISSYIQGITTVFSLPEAQALLLACHFAFEVLCNIDTALCLPCIHGDDYVLAVGQRIQSENVPAGCGSSHTMLTRIDSCA